MCLYLYFIVSYVNLLFALSVRRGPEGESLLQHWPALGSALAGWVNDNRCSWNPLSRSYGKCKKNRGWVKPESENWLLLCLYIQFNWVLFLDHSSPTKQCLCFFSHFRISCIVWNIILKNKHVLTVWAALHLAPPRSHPNPPTSSLRCNIHLLLDGMG